MLINTMAQVNVTGRILDKENNEPLVGASVIVKGAAYAVCFYSHFFELYASRLHIDCQREANTVKSN